MSRFIDELNQVSQAVPTPMGFRAITAARSGLKMLVIASLTRTNFNGVAEYVAGADAGLLRVSELGSGAEAIREGLLAVPDIPWGGWLKEVGQEEITQLVDTGCDFVVFTATTALASLQDDKVGRILEVGASLNEGLLKAVDKLPVDAVFIGGELGNGRFLTWQHLVHFQHYADLLAKPLVTFIPSNVTGSELQSLWEAGVDGVVVEVGVEQPAGRLVELRQTINSLTLSSQRRRGKSAALLPYVDSKLGKVTEEPEEED